MAKPLLFTDAIIHTGRSETETAGAMLVENGRIAALDPTQIPDCTRVSLGGRHVYPCLIDGHTHLLSTVVVAGAGFNVCDVEIGGVVPADMGGVEQRIRAFAQGRPKKAVIAGNNYILSAIAERRLPTREELDDWAGGRAIVIYTIDGHASALSTAMLKRLGIDPEGHSGQLFGPAHESVQGQLIDCIAASVTPRVIARGVAGFHNACARYGIACVGALEGNGDSEKDTTTGLIVALARRFDVAVKLYLQYIDIDRAKPYRALQRHARIGGCGEWEMDGATGAHSAAFSLPFRDTGKLAQPYYEQDFVDEVVARADAEGYQISSHAIGNLAINRIVHALRGANSGTMHRIEHCEWADDEAIEEIAKRGYALVMQPGYAWIDKRYLRTYEQFLPGEMIARLKFKTLYDKGICVCGSSDSPVQDLDPWLQMRGMVEFYIENESLTPYEAFRCYTAHPARALLEESERGTLEAGKRADFFTADEDIFKLPAERLGAFRPISTYYGGRVAKPWRGTATELLRMLLRKPKLV